MTTTVLQLLDNKKWTYHFLKNLHLLKWETYISNKTQYNHCFCKCCSHPHGRIHAHTSFLKESTFVEVGDIYLKKTQYNHCFCKCCSHPHDRMHAYTKEPLYSEFAIVPGCPSQLDLCTKTLPFILLLGKFKQTIF